MPKIETDTVRFRDGEFQGVPALRVCVNEPVSIEELGSAILGGFTPGHQVVWIDRAPWGQEFDALINTLSSTGRFIEIPWLAVRPLQGPWGNAEMMWIGDATAVLAESVSIDSMRETIQTLPFYPDLCEIIVRQPHPKNLVGGLLDELHANIRPQGLGWLYVSPENMDAAFRAVANARAPWGVRNASAL